MKGPLSVRATNPRARDMRNKKKSTPDFGSCKTCL